MIRLKYVICVRLAPYNLDNPTFESTIMSFWVVPPPENRILEYGRPMLMSYSVQQDTELSAEVHAEMDACIDYYKRYPLDMVDFRANYTHDTTYIEKLKVTLYSKFPQQQDDHQFWNWLRMRLGLSAEAEFTPPKWPAVRTTPHPPAVATPTLQQQGIGSSLLSSSSAIVVLSDDASTGSTTTTVSNKGNTPTTSASGASAGIGIAAGETTTLLNGTTTVIPHLDLTLDTAQTPPASCSSSNSGGGAGGAGGISSEQQSKEDKLLVRSLQEQLSLPSGLNMNPSPIASLPLPLLHTGAAAGGALSAAGTAGAAPLLTGYVCI